MWARALAAALAVLVAGKAEAQNEEPERVPIFEHESVSVGLATNGRLSWGVRFDDSEVAVVKMGSETSRHGTLELVQTIGRAASAVAAAFPGSRLMVGDLSHRLGGRLSPHDSHRAGRDVDLGFYLTDAAGHPVLARGFVGLNAYGHGRDRHGGSYRLDLARNWALVTALLADETVRVQFILINIRLKRLLLAHARASGVDPAVLARFEEVAANRSGSASHRSHFHVRIYCAPEDRPRCIDAPPFHLWAFTAEDAETRLTEWRDAIGSRALARARARARRHRGPRSGMRAAMAAMSTATAMSASPAMSDPGTLVARAPTMRTAPRRERPSGTDE